MPTLLVVDDNEKIVQLVQELMELKGFEILPTTSPEEALRVLDAHPGPIDLLVTDVVMPGTSGYVLSEQVKRCRPEIRVLFEKAREVLGTPVAVRTAPREPALGAWPSKRPSRLA